MEEKGFNAKKSDFSYFMFSWIMETLSGMFLVDKSVYSKVGTSE